MLSSLVALLVLSLTTFVTAAISVSGSIQPSVALPQLNSLPINTLLTLTTAGRDKSHETLVLADYTFVFKNVEPGSYLLDVNCLTHIFAPLRVDVDADGIKVYDTFRGNEWSNLGERKVYPIDLRAAKAVEYYITREGFNPAKLLSNPMILIAIVSVGGMVLMPKIIENMDPELRDEFEKTRAEVSLTNPAANPLQNFDMAGFLAGKSSSTAGSGSGSSTPKLRKQ